MASVKIIMKGELHWMDKAVNVNKVPLTRMRRIIRDRMVESGKVPQFTVQIDIEIDNMEKFRKKFTPKPSITACLVWTCSKILKQKKELNAFFYGDEIGYAEEVNISVAVAVEGGLLTPTIKNADKKSLTEISMEIGELAEKAKKGTISLDDLQGGTFTISNLGMYGISSFNALLNLPQVAIMSVGGISEGTRVRNGQTESFKYMTVGITADHRALDGAVVADFLAALKKYYESNELERGKNSD